MAKDSGADDRPALTSTGEGLFHRIRTGEWPVLKIDLSEAYANVRRRANRLRRRRIVSGVLASLVLAGLGTVVGAYYASAIPLPNQLALPATTTVYYSDGTTVMARLGSQRRTIVPADTLPDYVGEAVIAAEDPQYWITSGTLITRQYARAATVARGQSVTGATAEAKLLVLAWKIEDSYTKGEILEFYLNTVYFGRGSYGVEAAAQAYFGVGAAELTLEESILLAGVIESPGDGRYDPTVNLVSAATRFATVAQSMVSMGLLDQATASRLALPEVQPYDPAQFASGLAEPTGLIVAQVLAELAQTEAFRGRPAGYLVDGGFSVITTIDAGIQALLERTVDETAPGSLLAPQPRNVRAAAVVVQPGTGRVLAYFGGSNGTGADYAGTRTTVEGALAGFGYHPPAQTMTVFAMAAALEAEISLRSRWQAPTIRAFPASGHTAANPVFDDREAACRPVCTLAEAAAANLSIPFYALTERVGAAAVIDAAHRAGIGAMWSLATTTVPPRRYDLDSQRPGTLVPQPFSADVALGAYPVTVLDQATAMATFAAGGDRSTTHFVSQVAKDQLRYYEARVQTERALDPGVVADITAVLADQPDGQIPGGAVSAGMPGTAPHPTSRVESAHAWYTGFTPHLGVAVWVGNADAELPLQDAQLARIYGETLPAQAYREIVAGATALLGALPAQFPPPVDLGDRTAGDAPAEEPTAVG